MGARTHILAIPFPLQGHINPMTQLCKRLVSKGIRVTLVTTTATSTNLQKKANPNLISIDTVPDVHIDEVENLDFYENFCQTFRGAISNGLPEIIQKHSSTLKAVLYDSVIPWILDIAHEHGLKGAVFFTQPCMVSSVFYHLHKGTLEIPHDDASEVSLPCMPVMRLNDFPSFVFHDKSSYPSLARLLISQFSTFENADWRLFNTFDKLEYEILKWMANQHTILTVGPTVPSMYLDKRLPDDRDYNLSLFKADAESCIKWLDMKEDHSVIYVSFGSLLTLGEKQMEELARGLIDSEFNFLWVVQNQLPQNLIPDPPEKGLLVKWCPQLEVLSHRSVGCFITHCGWNSAVEALSLGVPMVAMPQWTDQTTNAKLIADVLKIGVRVKSDKNGIATREEIASCVKDVVKGKRGDEIRKNAVKFKDLAIESVGEGGSSDKNITDFVLQLRST